MSPKWVLSEKQCRIQGNVLSVRKVGSKQTNQKEEQTKDNQNRKRGPHREGGKKKKKKKNPGGLVVMRGSWVGGVGCNKICPKIKCTCSLQMRGECRVPSGEW